jgi:co-chaperonin GroES (HSP10)
MQIADLIATLKIESTPRGARIMVLPFVQARHGFIVDTEENRELPECGVVIALGPGGTAPESGRPIPVVSTVGDVVWFGKYAGLLTACETPMGPAKVFLMQEASSWRCTTTTRGRRIGRG